MRSENEFLKNDNYTLKSALIHSDTEKEATEKALHDLSIKLEKAKEELSETFAKNKLISKEKSVAEKKLSDQEIQIVSLQNETKNLKIEVHGLKNEIKVANKTSTAKEKDVSKLVEKNSNLEESVKNHKIENKVLKEEKKSFEKGMSKLEKKVTELKFSKSSFTKSTNTSSSSFLLNPCNKSTDTQLDKNANFQMQQSTISCQTDSHPDILYHIQSPLPPLFGSKLCYYSRHLKSMSSSLPDLWNVKFTTTDDLLDAAEEALAEEYEKEVDDFYLEEKERARKIEENDLKVMD